MQIGIIGGSGFYQMPELQNACGKKVETEFGDPTDQLMEGTIHGVPVVVLSRLETNRNEVIIIIAILKIVLFFQAWSGSQIQSD